MIQSKGIHQNLKQKTMCLLNADNIKNCESVNMLPNPEHLSACSKFFLSIPNSNKLMLQANQDGAKSITIFDV